MIKNNKFFIFQLIVLGVFLSPFFRNNFPIEYFEGFIRVLSFILFFILVIGLALWLISFALKKLLKFLKNKKYFAVWRSLFFLIALFATYVLVFTAAQTLEIVFHCGIAPLPAGSACM